MTLLNNGGDALTLSTSGSFAFATRLTDGSSYAVAVGTQPVGQKCTVLNGAGTVAGAIVTAVRVNCVAVGRFAYVTTVKISSNIGDNTVESYAIDTSTGALGPMIEGPVPVGNLPRSVAVDDAGQFAYVAVNYDGTVWGFAVDQVSGVLTPVPGGPFAAGQNPYTVTVDPLRRFRECRQRG